MTDEARQPSGEPGESPGDLPRGIAGRLRELWANRALRFVFLFLVYLSTAALVYPELRARYRFVLDALMRATARLEYYLFRLFTDDVSSSNTLVVMKGFSVKIIEECTGVYEALIFAAAVLAFPTSWKNKGIGFAFGIPMIYAFNAVRIAALIAVGRFYPSLFDFMHLYFWQATLIVMITSVWAVWIFKVVLREEGRPSHA